MKRDIGVAYLLLIFAGLFGGHRFYTRMKGSAAVMAILTITVFGAFISVIWVLVDLFLLPDLVKRVNQDIEQENAARRAPATGPGAVT